jgi:threonine aldolase
VHDHVDLRSDTLTLPTPEMREAMARAEVGDDVWEEDPTVKRLEAMAAERLGQPAGLLVTSGTQGNLVSVLAQTRPGQEVVLDLDSHIFNYEVAGTSVIGGVQMRAVKTARGFLAPDQVREALRPANIHLPPTGLVCVENTHNRHGGTCCAPEEIRAIAEVAHAAAVPVHLDGARLFNAAVASALEPAEIAGHADTVTICFSKGLGCPLGAIVAGSTERMVRARRFKHQFGGAMRQAGIVAAACVYALDHNVDRLADDHARAHRLAEALAEAGVVIDLERVETNFIQLDVGAMGLAEEDAKERLRNEGVLVSGTLLSGVLRAVTHLGITDEDIEHAIEAIPRALGAQRSPEMKNAAATTT